MTPEKYKQALGRIAQAYERRQQASTLKERGEEMKKVGEEIKRAIKKGVPYEKAVSIITKS